jgi:hypothetical protein
MTSGSLRSVFDEEAVNARNSTTSTVASWPMGLGSSDVSNRISDSVPHHVVKMYFRSNGSNCTSTMVIGLRSTLLVRLKTYRRFARPSLSDQESICRPFQDEVVPLNNVARMRRNERCWLPLRRVFVPLPYPWLDVHSVRTPDLCQAVS